MTKAAEKGFQRQFDFSAPLPRPFLASLPAGIDTYEEGVARFFRWRTGLDYYATIDQIIDFVINTCRMKVVDLLTDTGTFALRLAGRKAFTGKVYSFDSNITLLERARQRARNLNLQSTVEFRQAIDSGIPVENGFAELAVSIFDFHRQPAKQYLQEAIRILQPGGHLVLGEVLQSRTSGKSLSWRWKQFQLRFLEKKPGEARAVYFGREEMIRLLFDTGFRQVMVLGLQRPDGPSDGIFSLMAATK